MKKGNYTKFDISFLVIVSLLFTMLVAGFIVK